MVVGADLFDDARKIERFPRKKYPRAKSMDRRTDNYGIVSSKNGDKWLTLRYEGWRIENVKREPRTLNKWGAEGSL
jgi:hypothetical protein